ncbi:MAG: exodeoxyribonuclease VII large subunit [Chloroflexota bacterium]|nr:exodeoxyribonuclease VII large subunit [Chloroflexota bacterium]
MIQAYSVSELARLICRTLRGEPLLQDLWLEGELSNLRAGYGGHLYFTLKDEAAQVRCVMFGGQWRAVGLENGQQVLAHGRVDFWEGRGDLQFYVDFVQPAGVGLWQAQFEMLKAKLEAEGLFDPSRKRPLPPFPRRIGVATSPAGHVFHDICQVIGRRWPLAEVVLAPTPVQGPEAVSGLTWAIRRLNEVGVDVIIVARGGGSLEELWPFNEEQVARAIFASRAPVVSGVGHEPDVTIADLVADVRAPTPSAAAEVAVPDRAHLLQRLQGTLAFLESEMWDCIQSRRRDVALAAACLDRSLPDIPSLVSRALGLGQRCLALAQQRARHLEERLQGLGLRLAALDPRATLARGYAIVRKRGGPVVASTAQVRGGDLLDVYVADGHFPAEVKRQYGF